MKLAGDSLVFDNVDALEAFYILLDLQGILSLAEDLNDNTDKVLVKGGAPFKPSFFEKLREIRGSYKESFAVKVTSQLLGKISDYLTAQAEEAINEWSFFRRLYDLPGHRYQNYLRNAFKSRRIALSSFILYQDHRQIFQNILHHGLLTQAIVMHQYAQIRRIHIHAFLAGLLMNLGDPEGNLSGAATENSEALERLKRKSAELAGSLGAPQTSIDAILAQTAFTELAGELPAAEIGGATTNRVSIEEFLATEGQVEEASPVDDKVDPAALNLIREALKFARYVLFLRERIGTDEHGVEEISYRSAYNAKKGFFELKICEPVLKIFKEYEMEIRAMMKVGELESRCLFPPSAWAYPKPRPTQMVCKLTKMECPMIKPGWDLHVVSPQEAYGYIGTNLEPGRYLKCKLEDELKEVFERNKK